MYTIFFRRFSIIYGIAFEIKMCTKSGDSTDTVWWMRYACICAERVMDEQTNAEKG
jgi:hypothetical protein